MKKQRNIKSSLLTTPNLVLVVVITLSIIPFSLADVFDDADLRLKYETDATDDKGNYTCSVVGTPTVVTGKDGNALDFDVGEIVYCPLSVFPFGGVIDFTLSFWFKPNAVLEGEYLFGDTTSGGQNGVNLRWVNSTGRMLLTDGGSFIVDFFDFYQDTNEWYHIIVSGKESGVDFQKIYINGELKMSTGAIWSLSGAGTDNCFGTAGACSGSGSAFNDFDGIVDDFIIWNGQILTDNSCSINTTCGGEIGELYSYYNPPFNVEVLSPPELVYTRFPLNVSYKINTSIPLDVNCSLYLNDVLNVTNTSVVNNTITNMFVNLTEVNNYEWYLNCSDNLSSNVITNTRFYNFDNTEPFINLSSPLNNTVLFSNETTSFNFIASVINQNILWADFTVYNPNNTVLFKEYSGNITGATSYNLSKQINISALGTYTINVNASDLYLGINNNSVTHFLNYSEPPIINETNETITPTTIVSTELDFSLAFSIVGVIMIWIIVFVMGFITDIDIIRIFSGVIGIFTAIWLVANVPNFPGLVGAGFGLFNAYIIFGKGGN